MKSRTKGKKTASSPKTRDQHAQRAHSEVDISPWTEALFAAELLFLHATPIYYGFGVPRGDDSAVIIIPGFLGTDLYLMELHAWLGRIGYRPIFFRHRYQRRLPEPSDPAPRDRDRRTSALARPDARFT